MNNRNKNLQFIYTLAIGVVFMLSPSRAVATNDENHIQEIMAGVNGNSKIQFIVIKQEGGGNLWGPQASETQSRVMLVFFDATGREIGKFKFPHSVPVDTNPQLIATQDFANLPGAPTPDFIMPPLLNPIGGKVCFTNNPLNPNAFPRTDCVSYGSFPAAQTGTNTGGCSGSVVAGPPAAALPIMNTVSLKRTSTSCGSVANSDFAINTTPTPTNDALKTFTIPAGQPSRPGRQFVQRRDFPGQWADVRNLSHSESELRAAAEQHPVAIQYCLHDVRSLVHRRDEPVQLRFRLRLQSQHAGADPDGSERRAMHRYAAGHHNERKRNDSESQSADAGFADDVSCRRRHEPGLVRHRERQQLVFGNRLERHGRKSRRDCRFVCAGPGRSKANEDERGHGKFPPRPWSHPGKY